MLHESVLMSLWVIVLLVCFSPHKADVGIKVTSDGKNLRRNSEEGSMSYDKYLKWQLAKSTDPSRRKKWKQKEWNVKLKAFENRFQTFKDKYVFSHSKVLLVGARTGQEVVAMRNIGVVDSIGIDLVEDLPLVLAGDMHSLQFSDNTYDFIFSNVFDHALYPEKFGHELYRTLGWICLSAHSAGCYWGQVHRYTSTIYQASNRCPVTTASRVRGTDQIAWYGS